MTPVPIRLPMNSPELLTSFERCPRQGFYASKWESYRLSPTRMLTRALDVALRSTGEQQPGEYAGAQVLQDAQDRGLDVEGADIYSRVIHLAALSDIMVSCIRKSVDGPWMVPEPVQDWTSGAFLSPDGSHLRRIVLVSTWSDERHYSECRAWATMGEIAAYNLPMQMVVFVLGQNRNGKRHGPWTTGFLHPSNHQLRFRKKSRSTSEVFSDKWEKIFREDHAEISRETWLESMLRDDVLQDVCFKIDVPVPPERPLQRIRDMAARKMERLNAMKEKPEANLSTCDWPVPCQFRKLCHGATPDKEPSEKQGFVLLGSR